MHQRIATAALGATDVIVVMTYVVVVFSVAVQGLTLEAMIRRLVPFPIPREDS